MSATCPVCRRRPVAGTRTAWTLVGFFFAASFGQVTYVGCDVCTRRRVLLRAGLTSIVGWWCVPWGLAVPVIVGQNLWAFAASARRAETAPMLEQAGIDPGDWHTDDRGRSVNDTRRALACCSALHAALWADGDPGPERARCALERAEALAGGVLDSDEILAVFAERHVERTAWRLIPADRVDELMHAVVAVASVDRPVKGSTQNAVSRIARCLALDDAERKLWLARLRATPP